MDNILSYGALEGWITVIRMVRHGTSLQQPLITVVQEITCSQHTSPGRPQKLNHTHPDRMDASAAVALNWAALTDDHHSLTASDGRCQQVI